PTMGPSPTATALTLKFAADHLVCYKIKDDKKGGTQPTFKGKTVVIRNEIVSGGEEEETYDVFKSDVVCLPSTKIVQ
ncbi:MAG: hypothetical protein SF182_10485, partial [Deltaproteobacteria bacterium]|nr:hypothetical protein [Deltaproteobacteria bacterium]